MRHSTAVRHLAEMAGEAGTLNDRLVMFDSTMRLASLWAYGPVIEPTEGWDHQRVSVAIAWDLPAAQVPWLTTPPEVGFALSLVRWGTRPVVTVSRSADGPITNHVITRPLLLWRAGEGIHEAALATLRRGGPVEDLRSPAVSRKDLRRQLKAEQAISLDALRAASATYHDKRWGRGNPMRYADALAEATTGYLDVTDALQRTRRRVGSAPRPSAGE